MTGNHKISADTILDGKGGVHKDKVLILEESGRIVDIKNKSEFSESDFSHYKGTIIPGLINAHCHLELSHLKGVIPTGTGLVPFIKDVVQLRDFPQEEIDKAIQKADADMFQNGIQAVGDICNKSDTASIKSKSPISYYSFVEFFDLMNPAITDSSIEQYREAYNNQSEEGPNRKSMVPHAPYSVTPKMFNYLTESQTDQAVISMHNQETHCENQMFLENTGDMVSFFEEIGMPVKSFPAKGIRSINYALQFLKPTNKTLFVHNTMCTSEDLSNAINWSDKTFWVTCPNANLYIENKLPNYQLFKDAKVKMAIGTDSLSSNWQLSIWEEMKTILKFQSFLGFEEVLTWACINGAEALDYQDSLGSIEIGKSPGILLAALDFEEGKNDIQNVDLRRLL